MATKQVSIPDIGTVTLYKRRGNRSLKLSIGPSGEIRVSLPYWLPYAAGEQFVRSKSHWIANNRVSATKLLQHGHSIGKAHRLYFETSSDTARVQTRVAANEIRVIFPLSQSAHDPPIQTAAHKASIRALRKEAEVLLPQRLHALSAQTNLAYSGVSIKQLKGRWGSCSSNKHITLNLFLMQLPWHLIDYVLIHELTHTQIMRHGSPFWEEMSRHLPQAKQLRAEMASHQPILSPHVRSVA